MLGFQYRFANLLKLHISIKRLISQEVIMRFLISVLNLSLFALPAIADTAPDIATIPEPGVLGLVGIGAVALLVAHRRGRK